MMVISLLVLAAADGRQDTVMLLDGNLIKFTECVVADVDACVLTCREMVTCHAEVNTPRQSRT